MSCARAPITKPCNTALEFEFNVEVARNLGTPLMPVVAGQGRKVEGDRGCRAGAGEQSLEAKKCDILSVIVNRVAPDDVMEAAARFQEGAPAGFSRIRTADAPSPRQAHSCRNTEGSRG